MNAGDCLALLVCLLGWHHVCGTQWNQTTSLLVGYCFFPTATHVKIMWRLEDKNVFILFLIIFNRTRVLRPCTSPIVPAKREGNKSLFSLSLEKERESVYARSVFPCSIKDLSWVRGMSFFFPREREDKTRGL